MYEHRSQRLLSRQAFLKRQGHHTLAAIAVLGVGLLIGVLGFRLTEGQTWLDALYSATMLLTAMGLSEKPLTDCGKIFASAYAIFAAIVFLSAASILIAPSLHRLFHRLHLERDAERERDR